MALWILSTQLSVLCALLLAASSVNAQSGSSQPSISTPPTSSEPATETTLITLPISSYTFSSFPVPSASPIPGTFSSTSPKSPPPPGSELIPDFAPAWAMAHSRAKEFISGLTLEQKVNVSTGVGLGNGPCIGNTGTLSLLDTGSNTTRLSWPGLCLSDSPLGVNYVDLVTAFPAGITAASTWNRTLLRLRGEAMGAEFRGKGINVALSPVLGMGRVPQGGRNWEAFGADPFLAGEAGYETVLGLQQNGVQACAKHYINNEQEHKRDHESSHVDDRTEHEIYLHPFMRAVQAGVASVMCSYNQINASWACENERTLNQLLKGETGFQGYTMSDWGAHHSTLAAVAGLDMSMPGDISFGSGTSWWGANLTAFVENGTISESRVNDMAERIIAAWFLLGQDDNYPPVNFDTFDPFNPAKNQNVNVQADHYKLVREVAAAGTVLLKNVGGALPLRAPKTIAIIGNDAGPSTRGPNGYFFNFGLDGTLARGWGSGSTSMPYLITPLEAIQERARQDQSDVSWFLDNWALAGTQPLVGSQGFVNGANDTAFGQDVAIVFVNADSGEDQTINTSNIVFGDDTLDFGDRGNLTLWMNADNLINAVAAVNNNTIVVVHSVGPAILEPWIENPNVTAVVWANLPGQESGNSIVDVLYGDVNPSGKLPYTIARRTEDYPAEPVTGGTADEILLVEYTEKLNIDYRHFDANNIEPRFEFGFGLSYTNFSYSDLTIRAVHHTDHTSAALEAAWADGEASPNVEGGSTAIWLHRPAFEVSFTVANTGKVKGGEIPQLYLHFPSSAGEPPSVLRGFADVLLNPGQSKALTITLSRYDLSVWDAGAQGWRKPDGQFTFSVGASSRDFRLKGSVPL
ncbi:glycoside hydrolase [Lentinus tigrinus ALCF2SS1-6]|uniref:beta-glucosidase n=1 Tax=Lentinus tigrinus ALCF2SS1-6 TaxID=1328759 RepID=A0A5C2S6A2_9APHY|nr:glycoside hydrolase [Lentinus tigrinus ALCF2SS1-6]